MGHYIGRLLSHIVATDETSGRIKEIKTMTHSRYHKVSSLVDAIIPSITFIDNFVIMATTTRLSDYAMRNVRQTATSSTEEKWFPNIGIQAIKGKELLLTTMIVNRFVYLSWLYCDFQ